MDKGRTHTKEKEINAYVESLLSSEADIIYVKKNKRESEITNTEECVHVHFKDSKTSYKSR